VACERNRRNVRESSEEQEEFKMNRKRIVRGTGGI